MPAKRDYSQAIKEYKSGKSLSQIAKERHLCRHTLADRLRARDIPIRSSASYRERLINHEAFDILTDEAAYWIGFLMADGCVYQYHNITPRVKLELAHRDIDILEKFKSFLSAEHDIRSRTASFSGKTARYDRLDFASQRIVDRLAHFGVLPQKTAREQVYHLENNRHFWRGVVDGDGSLTWSAGYPAFHLVGGQKLMEQFCEHVAANLSIYTIPRNYKDRNVWTVCIYGQKASSLVGHLYSNQHIALKRKLVRARKFIAFYD